jgi:mannose-6-phosphate isomerase-like protein (cupin superfamily)
MEEKKKNYSLKHIGSLEALSDREYTGSTGKYSGKYFIGEELGLTGCEVSLNRLPAGKGMPFVHAHKKNEEVYIVLRGNGTFFIDGEEFPIQEGSLIRVAQEGARAWMAGDEDLYFICVQAEAGSLHQATREDGYIMPMKASWMSD